MEITKVKFITVKKLHKQVLRNLREGNKTTTHKERSRSYET